MTGGRSHRLLAGAVAVLAFLVFLPALKAGFVNWDDDKNILLNLQFRGLLGPQLRWMFTTFYEGMYQPLCWVSYGLDYTIWGLNSLGYHLTNLILHSLNAVLFFFVGLRLLRAGAGEGADEEELGWAAAFAALVFAVHPLRVESVAWVTERKDLLSGTFYLASVLCYLRSSLPLSLGFFAAGLLAKASGIGLPFILIALDYYPLKRFEAGWKKVLFEKIPYFALSFAAGLLGLLSKKTTIATLETFSFKQQVMQAFYGLAFYLRKSGAPFGLYPLHQTSPSADVFSSAYLLSAAAVIALGLLVLYFRKREPGLIPAAVVYLAILGPVLGFVRWNMELVADRYTYLACAGWAVLAGVLLLRGRARARAASSVAAVLLLAGLSALSWAQCGVWKSSVTLWEHVLAFDPDSSTAHSNYGNALSDAGHYEEALEQYREAVRLKPNYWDAAYNLANTLVKTGRGSQARPLLESVLKIKPDFANAHIDLGNVLQTEGRLPEAEAEFLAALKTQPDSGVALFNLANTRYMMGRREDARAGYEAALRAGLEMPQVHSNLGAVLLDLARPAEAAEEFHRALALDPGFMPALAGLKRIDSRKP